MSLQHSQHLTVTCDHGERGSAAWCPASVVERTSFREDIFRRFVALHPTWLIIPGAAQSDRGLESLAFCPTHAPAAAKRFELDPPPAPPQE